MSSTDQQDQEVPTEVVQPVQVLYCEICTFPPEYCEFGSSFTRCKEWLHAAHPQLFEKYYSEEALQSKLGTLSLEAQAMLEKDTAKKEAKAEAKADAALKKKMASQVVIKRIERNKRKYVTAIHGIEVFDIELKKAAKFLAQKFATGASVTKNAQGQDEIVVQGDVAEEVLELIENNTGIFKGIPAGNVEIVEDKKKKAAE
ncbi:eukaryotic translation initiation factor 1-like protein [Boletus edulis]|uniref:Translation machinery-associated protein 22 n=1 Tax=Boletus edulis BED1 TaxID=1328754 RepID=A0AAD4BKU2_BOLED|nr:eukaryotic translation initiation factor 1-like protein [Boletus edulis]KAF8432964.1 translation initiation factor SUI1 [Boletus edulis BED1]